MNQNYNMKTFSNFPNFQNEDLHYLLPKSLLEVLDKDSCYSSPQSIKNYDENMNTHPNSPKFTPSPQIPPLGSRLNTYLLKKSYEPNKPCNLSKFFDDVTMKDEIEMALKSIPQKIKIFEYLEEISFFEYVAKVIQEHENDAKPCLNAQATSFVPEVNKENIFPKMLTNKT